jgi:hypothetical protein
MELVMQFSPSVIPLFGENNHQVFSKDTRRQKFSELNGNRYSS